MSAVAFVATAPVGAVLRGGAAAQQLQPNSAPSPEAATSDGSSGTVLAFSAAAAAAAVCGGAKSRRSRRSVAARQAFGAGPSSSLGSSVYWRPSFAAGSSFVAGQAPAALPTPVGQQHPDGPERGDRTTMGMKLAYWMYTGPAHIGTLRVASSFRNVHAIMHAPLGDDYFNVMRSMLERSRDFTPVTASIVDRHVLARGSQEKVVENITRKDKEDRPDLIVLTPTCTSSILQEDLSNFCKRARESTDSDVILADVNHYRVNEHQASDRTLAQIVSFYLDKLKASGKKVEKTARPSANIIGTFTLGFHNSHDCRELKRMLRDMGIDTNLVVPEGACVTELEQLPNAWFNIVPYREVGLMSANTMLKDWDMPYVDICPMGVTETAQCLVSHSTLRYEPI
ncbi:unnamed protein product [Polarella glacialis]|uniref:Light-independent protochlorophyllide reductase subunit B n=1 Tax=Polarella glacialis TaxID=89957 RepID=A0A813F375_POLGL|nr:unnamed protein product [Polarella glacialis]CAE8608690.1 unnamed protein product [Polarella glacialis]